MICRNGLCVRFCLNDTATTEIDTYGHTLSLHDALPIYIHRQGFFIHEMTHVWQAQTRGRWFLIIGRMPWARYDYALRPGWPLVRYGIEQQAEIVRRSEEHTSELQSLMRISYAVFCLKKKKHKNKNCKRANTTYNRKETNNTQQKPITK